MFAVIYISDFSLQAVVRAEPNLCSQPVALIDPEQPKSLIAQINHAARAAGVFESMTPSQAKARCENVEIKVRSQAQEKVATEILLQTAYLFSPNIEATALGVCTLELKGLGLANEEAARQWADKILAALSLFYLDATIGMAPTPELALLAAHGKHPISIVRNPNEFVSELPMTALHPASEILDILSRWGIRTVGQFLALGKNEIAARFNKNALALFDRVSTRAVRPLKLISPPEIFSEQIEFEIEIETAAPLLFVLRRFVEQLSRRLEAVYLVVAEFHFQLGLASGDKYERVFKIPSPTGNEETLFRMLQTHLENVRTESSIVSLQLTALPAQSETHQFGFFERTLRDPNRFAETLASLGALLGSENVGTPQRIPTHEPDSFRMTRPNFDSTQNSEDAIPESTGLTLRRFRPPLPAQFQFSQEKPVLVRSQIFTGAIAETRGPFFSSGNWWDDTRWAREEWDVETSDGSILRIFRSNGGCFVEGVYD